MPYVPGGGGSSTGGSGGYKPFEKSGKSSSETTQRNPRRELVRGLARYMIAAKKGDQYDKSKVGELLRGMTPQEVKLASTNANIPIKQEKELVAASKDLKKINESNLGGIPGKAASPFMFALKQSSRPGQASLSALAEWSRQAESGKGTKIGPVNLRFGVNNLGKIVKAAGKGFALELGDSPVSIAQEAGKARAKQGLSTKSFGFVPGTDLRTGQALPGGAAGKFTYNIGGSIATDPLTYITFGTGGVGRQALLQVSRVLGAERAAEVASLGAKVLNASEKARLGKDVVAKLGRARGGIGLKTIQFRKGISGKGAISPGRTIIPYKGTALQRGVKGAVNVAESTRAGAALRRAANTVEQLFVPRAALMQAERAGRIPLGTADKVNTARVAWEAGRRADKDIRVLGLIARKFNLDDVEQTAVAVALDTGNRASLGGKLADAYDEYDTYRKGFSQELRNAGIIEDPNVVTQKRIDKVYDDYQARYEKLSKQAQKAREKADAQTGVTTQAGQKVDEAQLADLNRAEDLTRQRLDARQQALSDLTLATQQRQFNRAIQMNFAGARRVDRVAKATVKRVQKSYNLVVRAIASGDINEARNGLKAANAELSRLQRGLNAVESRIASLRKQRATLGVVGEAGQRRAVLDEQIRNLIDERNATRNLLGEAGQKASAAKGELDRLISIHGTPGVAQDLRGLSRDELLARRAQLNDELATAVDDAETASVQLGLATERFNQLPEVQRVQVPRAPGVVNPTISRSTAKAREVLAKNEMKRRLLERAAVTSEGRLSRLEATIERKARTVTPGIEDEFYFPHRPSINMSDKGKLEATGRNKIFSGSARPAVTEGPPGFAQRRTGPSLSEKLAADKDIETNPALAFAGKAIEGRRAIANKNYTKAMLDLTDEFGDPLMMDTARFDDVILGTDEAVQSGITQVDQITDDLRDAVTKAYGFQPVKIPYVGTFYADNALVPALKRVQTLTDPNTIGKVMRGYDRWMALWKSYATVPFPFSFGFTSRNGVGNFMQNWLAGVSATDPAYLQATLLQRKILRGRLEGDYLKYVPEKWKQVIRGAEDRDILGSSFAMEDLARDELSYLLSRGQRVKKAANPLDPEFVLVRYGRTVNQMVENNARLAHFIAKSRDLGNFDDAAASVRKYLFDYGDVTDFERVAMKRTIPFYTFMRKNTPLWVGAFFTDPVKFSRMDQFRKSMYEAMGNPDMGVVPYYLEEQGAVPSPLSLGGERTMLAPDLPPIAASETIAPLTQIAGLTRSPEGMSGALRQLINQFGGGPAGLAKTAVELSSGKELFSGRPFYPGEQAAAPSYLKPIQGLLPERVVDGEKRPAIPRTLQYAIEQNIPFLGKIESTFPSTKAGKDRQVRRLYSILTGLQFYPLGEPTVRSELFRRGQITNRLLEGLRSQGIEVPENLRREKPSSKYVPFGK